MNMKSMDLYLDTSDLARGIVRFTPTDSLTTRSVERAVEAMRFVRKSFRKANCAVDQRLNEAIITANDVSIDEIAGICAEVEKKLQKLRLKPLSSKAVESILSISSTERRRWSKDGRLPHVGTTLIKLGKSKVSFFLYSPLDIQAHLREPKIIAGWRSNDHAQVGRMAQADSAPLA